MSEKTPILELDAVRLVYRTPHGMVRAVQDATLAVRAGETVGLVGESGSGKSSLARAALGLLPPGIGAVDGGRIAIAGTDVTKLRPRDWEKWRGHPVAIVFQDPLSFLNPLMRIGRQIGESVRRHHPGVAAQAEVAALLDLVKLPATAMRAYPHELSGGMRQRVLLAIALGCRPDLLIADEPTTALDVTTQAEIMVLLGELRERLGMALLLISHDLGVVSKACRRIYVMYAGRTIEWGDSAEVFAHPAHPYTLGLLQAAKAERGTDGRFVTIGGDVSSGGTAGCPFAARCNVVMDRCHTDMPPAFAVPNTPTQTARCWRLA